VDAVRRASHAYLDFALAEPDLYQLMYGLGGVRVPPTETWNEGQAVGDVLTDLLTAAGDSQPGRHVLQLWATAHGLMALHIVGRVDIDVAVLHGLLDDAVIDVLARARPAAAARRSTRSARRDQP
ncbi:MAG: TetR-like C-terminal domain-containing protein, partial [Steroidobacteraceae bacterium]